MSLAVHNALAVLVLVTVLWGVSVARRDVSIVDPWWSILFLLVSFLTVVATGATPAKVLILSLVALWALRLWAHLLIRGWGEPEDPRYTAFRRRFGPKRYWWVSFFQVFLLQGALALVISSPLQLALASATGVRWNHIVGAIIVLLGFGIEAVADQQLQSFRRRRKRTGERGVLDSGLWRWSRHPNYFGEALLGWGFWVCALDCPWGWATVFAPALMTFLLLRVSGVTMLDAHLLETKPGYAEYLQRTAPFFPRPPRKVPRIEK